MPFKGPSPPLPGAVIHDKPLLYVQTRGTAQRPDLAVRKDMPLGCASLTPEIPGHHDIAIRLTPEYAVAEEAHRGWQRSIMASVIAVTHVDEELALRRQQTRKLAQNLNSASGGENMSEDIPETSDDVKLSLYQVKILG